MMKTGFSKRVEFVGGKISIHFIYTFLFTKLPFETSIHNHKDEKELTDLIKASLRENAWEKVEAKICWTAEQSVTETYQDKYLESYLHLKIPRIEMSMKNLLIEPTTLLEWDGSKYIKCRLNVSVIGNILILASGQGVLVYNLDIEPEEGSSLDKIAIVNLANIGMRKECYAEKDELNREFSKFKLVYNDDREFFLFPQFFKDINSFEKCLQKKFKENQISWIEVCNQLNLVDNREEDNHNAHFQDPYPIMVLTVPDDIFAISFLDIDQFQNYLDSQKHAFREIETFEKKRKVYHKDLLTILSRSKAFDFPSVSFFSKFGHFSEGELQNMCSTSLVFIHLYSRSTLVVIGEAIKSQLHGAYIIPALIDTIEYLRMRWHICVVSIQWLNKVIEKLYQNEVPFEKALEMIISARREIVRGLCDPIVFRTGSGSMNKIYEIGLNIFRIGDLEKMLSEKFDMIDRLYANLFERQRMNAFEKITKNYNKD